MPIIKSAKKAARQATKRRGNNEAIKKTIRTALKDFKNKPTSEKMAKVQSEYDKAVKKGLMKKATASRRKAKLAAFAKANNVKVAASAKKAAPKAAAKPAAEKKAPAKKAAAAKKPAAKKPAAKKTAAKKAEK
jgi:ribosomal protein S20